MMELQVQKQKTNHESKENTGSSIGLEKRQDVNRLRMTTEQTEAKVPIHDRQTEFVSLHGGGRRAKKKNERIVKPTVKPIEHFLRLPNCPFPLQLYYVCLLHCVCYG